MLGLKTPSPPLPLSLSLYLLRTNRNTTRGKKKTIGQQNSEGNSTNQNRPLRGQEEGRASIPSESMVQGLKFPSQNPNPRGEEGGRERTVRGRREECCSSVLAPGERKKQGERKGEGGERVFNPQQLSTQKTKLPLELKIN